MYRDDDVARAERASILIDEIAELERQKLLHASADRRIETARRELSELQPAQPPPPHKPPGLVTHLLVFGATGAAAFAAYTLLL